MKLTEKLLPHYSRYSDQWIYSLSSRIDVSELNVEHANRVWGLLECKNFADYLMLYLKTDVILEKSGRLFEQVFAINPCH